MRTHEQAFWNVFACLCCGTRVKSRSSLEGHINHQGACVTCGSRAWEMDTIAEDQLTSFKSLHQRSMATYKRLDPDDQV